MPPLSFNNESLPGVDTSLLSGVLIALEGQPKGLGERLVHWLEAEGYAAICSRGEPMSSPLWECAEFAERLEISIIPALRAGFIVIADGYVEQLRDGGGKWMEKVTGFVLQPHLTLSGKTSFKEAQRRIAEVRATRASP